MVFKFFCVLVLWTKVASALEGRTALNDCLIFDPLMLRTLTYMKKVFYSNTGLQIMEVLIFVLSHEVEN